MSIKNFCLALSLFGLAGTAAADLTSWTDYDISANVSNVTTVKVDSNMIDKYLEGLRATWVTGNEAAKALGQIKDYGIYVSQLPNGGQFNVVLVVEFESAADLQPNKEDYDAFMQKWGEDNKNRTDEIVPTYPDIRTITGEYLMRKITIK